LVTVLTLPRVKCPEDVCDGDTMRRNEAHKMVLADLIDETQVEARIARIELASRT